MCIRRKVGILQSPSCIVYYILVRRMALMGGEKYFSLSFYTIGYPRYTASKSRSAFWFPLRSPPSLRSRQWQRARRYLSRGPRKGMRQGQGPLPREEGKKPATYLVTETEKKKRPTLRHDQKRNDLPCATPIKETTYLVPQPRKKPLT